MAMRSRGALLSLLIFLSVFVLNTVQVQGNPNYRDALAKSILFFQGQRSGRLPAGAAQQMTWRSNSGLSDGLQAHVIYISYLLPASHHF